MATTFPPRPETQPMKASRSEKSPLPQLLLECRAYNGRNAPHASRADPANGEYATAGAEMTITSLKWPGVSKVKRWYPVGRACVMVNAFAV